VIIEKLIKKHKLEEVNYEPLDQWIRKHYFPIPYCGPLLSYQIVIILSNQFQKTREVPTQAYLILEEITWGSLSSVRYFKIPYYTKRLAHKSPVSPSQKHGYNFYISVKKYFEDYIKQDKQLL
jgi:hypothetical protein